MATRAAALRSPVREVTGKPIKFIGVGEKTDALEPFHPDRLASRILGMGDVLTLVEEVQQKTDREKSRASGARKLKKGKASSFYDLREQLQQMISMGGSAEPAGQASGTQALGAGRRSRVGRPDAARVRSRSSTRMTPRERRFPDLIDASRKRRIASGAGMQVQDINRLARSSSRRCRR